MKKSTIIATVAVITILGIVFLFSSDGDVGDGSALVYETQQECELDTGYVCSFTMCDYVPEGKTFDEVCGKDFRKGWVPTNSALALPDPTGDGEGDLNSPRIIAIREIDEEGALHIHGLIDLPTPCHALTIETRIAESYPEQVTIDFTIQQPPADTGCIQIITPTAFDLELNVAERATFNSTLNGERAMLEFTEK